MNFRMFVEFVTEFNLIYWETLESCLRYLCFFNFNKERYFMNNLVALF